MLSMHTVKPLAVDAVLAAARDAGVVVTLEEHSIIDGLGSAVAEYLAERSDIHPVFKRLLSTSAVRSRAHAGQAPRYAKVRIR